MSVSFLSGTNGVVANEGHIPLSKLRIHVRAETMPRAGFSWTSTKDPCFGGESPLPPGEGGAKRRVRAEREKLSSCLPSSGPSGHLLPKGEGLVCQLSVNLDSSGLRPCLELFRRSAAKAV